MKTPPDLVLFMTDQQRYDQVGYASGGHFETPNLDALAARGVVFENAYSTSTTCVPARVGLLTGLLHHRVPTQINRYALREGFWTIARALRAAGYETALFGKMHFFPVHADHGFETMRLVEHLRADRVRDGERDDYHVWLESMGIPDWRDVFVADNARTGNFGVFPHEASVHPTGWIEREVHRFLAGRDRSRPLFLIVSFPHPHAPYNPAEPYASMYDPDDARLPTDTAVVNDGLPPAFKQAFEKFGGRRPSRVNPEQPELLARFLTIVRSLVKHIDDAMGSILRELDEDETVVFFTSDHGDWAGHRGALGKIPWIPFDDLARVPFAVAGPGVAGGRRIEELVQTSDFVPTCLSFAGIESEVELDARSLAGVLQGAPAEPDRAVFSATTMGWPMVRKGRFKYIFHRGSWSNVLFDLVRDPGETTTLRDASEYADTRTDLIELLNATLARDVVPLQPSAP